MSLFSDSLIWPAITLGLLGYLMPRLLARLLPEGVKPLILNVFLSTLILFALSAIGFVVLYVWQGAELDNLLSAGTSDNIWFFGKLGAASAIIWAPVMILSAAGLPRKWVHATW